jgi:hypothetical protein
MSTGHSLSSNGKIKDAWSYSSIPPYTISQKTVNISSSHSHQFTIKEVMIMLRLHDQNTAAVQIISGQAEPQKYKREMFLLNKRALKYFA